MDQRNWWFYGISLCLPSQRIGLYSIKGRLLRIDLIKIWKAFHSDIEVGLSDIFKYAINTRTRGHAYKLSIPGAEKM